MLEILVIEEHPFAQLTSCRQGKYRQATHPPSLILHLQKNAFLRDKFSTSKEN